MVGKIHLSFIFVFACVVNTVMAGAPLAPVAVKQLVENSSDYAYCPTDKTTQQVALDVLATNSLDPLLTSYSVETIFSWNQGRDFIRHIQCSANDTAKNKLANSLKIYTQKQLKKILCDDILNEATPTSLHMLHDYETTDQVSLDLGNQSYYQQHLKRLAPMLCAIVKEEKILNDQGYCVFFHGQRWEYLFGEKLYTDLWALTKHKKRPTNYLFAHVRIKGCDPVEKYGSLQRTRLLNTGWQYYEFMLWTTNSLFSNYRVASYSSPLSYFLKNDNFGEVKFSLKNIFAHYKLSHLYKKHSDAIAALEKHYNNARTLGTILRVAIPKTMVNDYCFHPSCDCNDTLAFLDTLKNNLDNTMLNNKEFCIVMLDKAMDPEGGILIKPYHCAEPTEYQHFEAGYEKLITELEAEITSSH